MGKSKVPFKTSRVVIVFVTLLLSGPGPPSLAQDIVTGALNGVVVDAEIGRVLPGVRVDFINEATRVTTKQLTNSHGRVYQGMLPPGEYIIRFSATNYEPRELRQRVFATRDNTIVPIPVMLDPIKAIHAVSPVGRTDAGHLAVAAPANSRVRVAPISGGNGSAAVIAPEQLLCSFDDVPAGRYVVTTELEGYRTARQEVIVEARKTTVVTMMLLPNEASVQVASRVGKYYALVIGNNGYDGRYLPRLQTAENDAKAVEVLLRERFGFETKLLLNARRQEIVGALSEYRRNLSSDTNLLIYYAGHGYNDAETERAYWLPVDATKDDPAYWISADDITGNIKGIRAAHVLIVSDSCYSGAITRGINSDLGRPDVRGEALLKMAASRSRTLLASGGNEPVADSGAGRHSVFAGAFLKGLEAMYTDIFTAEEIYINFIWAQVAGGSQQTPKYSFIQNSGHDNGEFIFVRKK